MNTQGTLGKISRQHNYNLLHMLVWIALLSSLTLPANSQIPDQSKPLPLGTLVDVGGYRVHLYCIGQGSPTVMIVGAAFSFDWGLVQPEVAKFTRVCTFDPSGTAWSDPFKAPNPDATVRSTPTCTDRVDEIHRLITKTPIDGPYVLVGFSVGALWERLYAAMYPDNIAGMVIVDHAFLPGANDAPPHPANSPGSSRGYSPPVLLSKAPIVIGFEDDGNFSKLPRRDQELHRWAISQHPVRPGYEMAADCFSLIESITGQRPYPLGNTQLTVISTPNEAPGYAELQTKLLALSHNSEQAIAQNSSHMVPIDEPEVIVKAIHKVFDGGRRQSVEPRIP
jgi:pimeloyl-ACP methyl ester carboxylesterase